MKTFFVPFRAWNLSIEQQPILVPKKTNPKPKTDITPEGHVPLISLRLTRLKRDKVKRLINKSRIRGQVIKGKYFVLEADVHLTKNLAMF